MFAADAVSRLTGIPGVAAVTAGPGVTNAVTALKNAQMAKSPLILLGGAPATVLKGRGALQDIEQLKLLETIVKWSASITRDCDIVPILEEAFDVAVSGIPGPVFVECPIDLLYDRKLVGEWYAQKTGSAKGWKDSITNWYLRRHVDKLFACSSKSIELAEKEQIAPFFVDPDDIETVIEMLKNSKAPVLVVGSQTALQPRVLNTLAGQLKKFGVPVFLTGMTRGLMGPSCPLQFHHGRAHALKEADLVIVAGIPCDFRLNYGRSIGKNARYVAINRSKEDLKKNKTPDVAVLADPSAFLLELTATVQFDAHRFADWMAGLSEREAAGEKKIQAFMRVETGHINPLSLCEKIDRALASDSVVVGDGGDFVATASYIVHPRGPLSWLDPGAFGTLGVGAGFAIAAKLVQREAEVWLLYGDGAAGYGLMEIDTFVRHNLPIITVIGNDAGWTQIARDQVELLGDGVGTVLKHNHYHAVAEALDAKGILLDKGDDIETALKTAQQISRNGQPVVVNALIGRTDFRKGSISV